MGVIYKITDDVVNFLIQQKRTNAHLSCRQLADLASQTFHVHLSKSSVNEILKRSQLSSPVGRRAKNRLSSKKFEIPYEKKKQILENLEKVVNSDRVTQTPVEIKPVNVDKIHAPPIVQEPDISSKTKLVAKENEIQNQADEKVDDKPIERESIGINNSIEPEKDLEIVPKLNLDVEKKEIEVQDFSKAAIEQYIQICRQQKFALRGPLLDGAGLIVFRSIWRSWGGPFIWEEILQKYIRNPFSIDFSKLCELYLSLKILGINQPEGMMALEHHAVWPMTQIRANIDGGVLFDTFVHTMANPMAVMECLSVLDQATTEVRSVRIVMDGGEVVELDPWLTSVFETSQTSPMRFCPMPKAVDLLSKMIVSNTSSLIIQARGPFNLFANLIQPLLNGFARTAGKGIRSVALVDETGDDLTSFKFISPKIRSFILALDLNDIESHQLIKHVKWVQRKFFYNEIEDRTFLYSETLLDASNPLWVSNDLLCRVITIWPADRGEQDQSPCDVLITNNLTSSIDDLLAEYYRNKSGEVSTLKSKNQSKADLADLLSLADHYDRLISMDSLFSYLKDKVFSCAKETLLDDGSEDDINLLLSTLCSIPGYIYPQGEDVFVELSIENIKENKDKLERIIHNINRINRLQKIFVKII